jgi:hypothetical protein
VSQTWLKQITTHHQWDSQVFRSLSVRFYLAWWVRDHHQTAILQSKECIARCPKTIYPPLLWNGKRMSVKRTSYLYN